MIRANIKFLFCSSSGKPSAPHLRGCTCNGVRCWYAFVAEG